MKNKKSKILFLVISIFTIIFNIGCSSAFTATISGNVKTEPRNNSSSDEQTALAAADVYVFFNEDEWNAYKTKWENFSTITQKSITTTIDMPKASKTIRETTTNANGGFSIKTMWITTSPLFGKDGDEKTFHVAVYHKDYGMFFDDTTYSVFSDSSQNISFICQYDEKQKAKYTIELNTLDYSNNNEKISISDVDPKVVIKYKLETLSGEVSDVGEITQVYETLPENDTTGYSNDYSFICDKYYYDSVESKYTNDKVYPVGTIYFYDKGADGEKNFRMCDDFGNDLSSLGTTFNITTNSNILSKDIYVDRLNRDYRISFDIDYPDNDQNDYSGNPPTTQSFSPKVTLKVYFDGYDSASNSISTQNSTIEASELYKTFNYNVDEVPEDGYYTFNINRMFDSAGNEVFPKVTYLLEDDANDIEYLQTDISGNLINTDNTLSKTLTAYSKDNYSTTSDTYVDKVKLTYTVQFNLENFEDGSTINLATDETDNSEAFDANVKLIILPYVEGDDLSALDFTSSQAVVKTPDERINNNTFSFDWDKYNSNGKIQYPAIKYYIYDEVDPQYCQVESDNNIDFTHIKDLTIAKSNVEPIIYKKRVLNKSIDVDVEKLNEDYSLNFTLNDIEDNNKEISFTEFSPKVKLNIYKTSINAANLIDTQYIQQTKTDGIYTFNWDKYGKDIDLVDLPLNVNSNKIYPIVKYYLFNTDEDSYQMLEDNNTTTPTVVSDIDSAPNTSLFKEYETSKDIDVYIRSKKITYNLTLKLINIATNNEVSLSTINPIVRISYNDGIEDVIDTYNNIPRDNVYTVEITRDSSVSNPTTNLSIDLEDKRNEVRYRLCSNDPTNSNPDLRYTVGTSETNRYEQEFTLNKANDNELKMYVKDYQYPSSINIEGRFIENDNTLDNGHTVWLLPEINNAFSSEDLIQLASPTHSNYKNSTDTYDPSNIENGYFSTTYNQNRIATFDQYSNSSKYLEQQFKVIVNKVQNETNPSVDTTDYMSVITTNNNSNNSVYVYVDNSTTYKE
ncbi:MAG: hypothetical protein ACPKOI_13485 [Pleomorphochaeta sp.]